MAVAPAHPLRPVAEALDQLGIATAVFDAEDRVMVWNACFIRFFPEHHGHIHVGESYGVNLRRFYEGRLDPSELPYIERYIADGIRRHQRQSWPFEFCHRGQWLRVASLPTQAGGRIRIWQPIQRPEDAETLARCMAAGGREAGRGSIDQIADGLMARDAEGRILFANRRFLALYGLEVEAQAAGTRFDEILARCWQGMPGGKDAILALTDNARFTGAPFELPLPGDRWVRVTEHRAADGSLIGTHVDITDLHRLQRRTAQAQRSAERLALSLSEQVEERARAEAQLRASETRMRRMLDAIPVPLICCHLGETADIVFVNRQFTHTFGYTPPDLASLAALAQQPCPDTPAGEAGLASWPGTAQDFLALLRAGQALEQRIRCKDGTLRDVLVTAEIMEDLALISLVDITERKRAEAQQSLLAQEIDHRAKNALAVVQAALRLTPKEDAAAYATAVEGRITALARVHSLLSADRWRGADLRALLARELAPFIAGAGAARPRVDLQGPDLLLPAAAAQPLAMAVHELATNAVKYGGLSVPGGSLSIHWQADQLPGALLRLRWTEVGAPQVAGKPARRGFGSRLIEMTIRHQLGGRIAQHWTPQGLDCEIEVPLQPAAPAAPARPDTARHAASASPERMPA